MRTGPQRATPLVALVAFLSSPACAFYLPGMAPTSYAAGDSVPLHVNNLKPFDLNDKRGLKAVVSYDYYRPEFHFCPPVGGAQSLPESLGSIIFGDRLFTSPFEIKMKVDEPCKSMCPDGQPVTFTDMEAKIVNTRIKQSYLLDWLVDGLPAAMEATDPNKGDKIAVPGFPLGSIDSNDGDPVFHNHFDLIIDYHKYAEDQYRVVAFTVLPYSHKTNKVVNGVATCGSRDDPNWIELSEQGPTTLTYTYGVKWVESPTVFATRWDKYLHIVDPQIHWLWLINTAVIVLLLVGMVSTVLTRTLRKDIARYNRLDEIALEDLGNTGVTEETVAEDSGWKLVHGDVFRPPSLPLPLSVLIGNGVQLFLMGGFITALALFGFLSPSNRGALGTAVILFSTFFSIASGYVSARVYKFFNGEGWKRNFIYTPVCLPLSIFSTFFVLNLIVWARGASGAVPFGTMLFLVLLWFVISLPFSLAGSWLGFKAAAINAPTRTNQIPRQIPSFGGSLYLRPVTGSLISGVLPFVAIAVELSFIMSSLWSGRIYYMFGFLFLCFGLMAMMCATVTVLMVYFILCAENYHWQWRAFFSAGATGVWVFVYSIYHWLRFLSLQSLTGTVLYFGYSALMSSLIGILAGSIGFLASWFFVLRIYGSIKVD